MGCLSRLSLVRWNSSAGADASDLDAIAWTSSSGGARRGHKPHRLRPRLRTAIAPPPCFASLLCAPPWVALSSQPNAPLCAARVSRLSTPSATLIEGSSGSQPLRMKASNRRMNPANSQMTHRYTADLPRLRRPHVCCCPSERSSDRLCAGAEVWVTREARAWIL